VYKLKPASEGRDRPCAGDRAVVRRAIDELGVDPEKLDPLVTKHSPVVKYRCCSVPRRRPIVKSKTFLHTLALALLLPVLAAAEPAVYKVDGDHSAVNFQIRHFVSNVSGHFRDFDGTVKYDKQNPAASSVEFTVKAASIDTSNNDRDEHLRSKDFFDVQNFPSLTFTSTKVAAKDANTLEVTGNLTLHGVTKQVTIPVEVLGSVKTPRGEKAGFETNFTVNRKEYGINWNNVLDSGPVLGDEVKVNIAIEANRQVEKAGK
jgi:polyisoprenoid-binding protein YceI